MKEILIKILSSKIALALAGCLGYVVAWGVILAAVFGVGAFTAWVVELLWNMVVPPVFHGPVLPFWPAYALVALVCVGAGLFKTFATPAKPKSKK